jgi:glycosyl hydrolase family 12/cellulose binding protein with CBM2 domain
VTRSRYALAIAATLLLALGTFLAARAVSTVGAGGRPPALSASPAAAASTTLCQLQTEAVAGGTYVVQNNEFDSSAPECVSTDGSAGFTVPSSSISNATNGSPGAYPSIYQGCHWGNCSSGGLSAHPVQVAGLTPGAVTTSWSTTQPGGGSAYDVAYDIWFNQTPATTGQPNGSELMVWLNHNGPVQPFGSEVASNVTLGGHTYNIWEGAQSSWDTVTYEMTSPATEVAGLDVGTLAQDMVSRGYTQSSWYLIGVEAGFELWQGGAGLETDSFSVTVNGSPAGPAPTPTATSAAPSSSPASPGAGASCSGTYSVVSSWPGGFQGQVVVTNTGSATLNSWQLGWTFPGSQAISNLWNGNRTQSAGSVTVTNASYNGTLAPGASTTVGFTATYAGSNTAPSGVSCR